MGNNLQCCGTSKLDQIPVHERTRQLSTQSSNHYTQEKIREIIQHQKKLTQRTDHDPPTNTNPLNLEFPTKSHTTSPQQPFIHLPYDHQPYSKNSSNYTSFPNT